MLNSMTGFGSSEGKIAPLGKVCVELRSSNHKFFEVVFHLPEGFLSLEERMKKEIDARIKRGRIICAVRILGSPACQISLNKKLLGNYISALKSIKQQFQIKGDANLDTLIHLPGVLSLAENKHAKEGVWPQIRRLLNAALMGLVKTRQREGRALHGYFLKRLKAIKINLAAIQKIFKKTIKKRLTEIQTDEERSAFLKEKDINEELERLSYHLKNFSRKISGSGAVGKELDFIAQELQREVNTMGAKSCAAAISSRTVYLKSQIEKLREQLQNIE